MKNLSSLIAVVVLLSGCAGTIKLPESAPKPPVIPICDLIATESTGQYLRCKWNAQGDAWRIPISDLYKQPVKYLCTTDKGYADSYSYGKKMEAWASKNCK
jgi:uncharacterized protein YceK